MTPSLRRFLTPLLLASILFASACSSTDGLDIADPPATTGAPGPVEGIEATQAQLDAAREMWVANGLTDYVLDTQQQCFCPNITWRDTIIDEQVVDHRSIGEDDTFDPGGRTMIDLFDEVQLAIDDEPAAITLETDPDTGAIVSFWVDVEEFMADEEYGALVLFVGPVDDAPPLPVAEPSDVEVDADRLTTSHGCGYGFAKGSDEQDLGLVIFFEGEWGPGQPDMSRPISWPTDEWSAEVHVGRNLFANWCDDVVEVGEPEPEIAEVWTVVEGTLVVTSAPTGDCTGAKVVGELTDVVVANFVGEQRPFGDVSLANASWGCFAG